jgi:competence protein ComFC
MVEELVKIVKYKFCWSYTQVMAGIILENLRPQLKSAKIDFLLPVPLAGSRKKWRGFNQAEILAMHIGTELRIPVESHALRRRNERTNQAKLNKQERQSLNNDYEVHPTKLYHQTVCLIDDVVTTGATLEACAAALHEKGTRKIYGLTFAAA